MAALRTTKGNYTFVWLEYSPYIEVFRKQDPAYAPYEVFEADVNYNQSNFHSLVNNHPDYK